MPADRKPWAESGLSVEERVEAIWRSAYNGAPPADVNGMEETVAEALRAAYEDGRRDALAEAATLVESGAMDEASPGFLAEEIRALKETG